MYTYVFQKNSSGSLVIKVEPGYHEPAGLTELFVRAHFDYNPRQDRLIPSQDAGMTFRKGDIIKILNQEDSFWWQAMQQSDRSVAGLIPSQILEERLVFNRILFRLKVGNKHKAYGTWIILYTCMYIFLTFSLLISK